MTAQWVLRTADAERAVRDEMTRQQCNTILNFDFMVDFGDDLRAFAANAPQSSGPARHFHELCARFSPDRALYSMYRRLFAAVHPSLATMDHHLVADDERGVHAVRRDSAGDDSALDMMLAPAMSAVFSVNAIEILRRGQSGLAAIHAIADRHEVPRDLSSDDTAPPPSHDGQGVVHGEGVE